MVHITGKNVLNQTVDKFKIRVLTVGNKPIMIQNTGIIVQILIAEELETKQRTHCLGQKMEVITGRNVVDVLTR